MFMQRLSQEFSRDKRIRISFPILKARQDLRYALLSRLKKSFRKSEHSPRARIAVLTVGTQDCELPSLVKTQADACSEQT